LSAVIRNPRTRELAAEEALSEGTVTVVGSALSRVAQFTTP
jgi:hypothetical protein